MTNIIICTHLNKVYSEFFFCLMDPYGEDNKWENEIQAIKAFSSGTYIKVNDRLVPEAKFADENNSIERKKWWVASCEVQGADRMSHLMRIFVRSQHTQDAHLLLCTFTVSPSHWAQLFSWVLLVLSLSQPVPRSVRIVFCIGHSLQVPHSWLPLRCFK